MRFTEEVVLFDFAGIPMVGCLGTGYAIGLTEQGAAVCARMLEEDVPEDDVTAVDPALLEHLARGGFFQRVVAEPRVLSAYLHVTQRCNLACAGCYSLDEHRNRLADAPLADMKRAVEGLAAAGLSQLIISGGEPLLREDLPDIVEHAKRACGIASVTVLSNGTRMTEEALERLAPNVDCVSVSFDGCSAAAPAYIRSEQRFDELVEAVRMVQRAGIPAHIIPTVHAKNVDDLASYVQLSRDLGASLNFSLLTCEPDDEVLGGLLPGADELRMLGRALLTLDNGKPLPAMDAPVGVNLTVKRNCGAGCKSLKRGRRRHHLPVPHAASPGACHGQRVHGRRARRAADGCVSHVPNPRRRKVRGLRSVPVSANLRGRLPSPLAVRIGQPGVEGLLLPDDPGILRRPGKSHVRIATTKEVKECCSIAKWIRMQTVLFLALGASALLLVFRMLSIIEKGLFLETGSFCYFDIRIP